jgi:hypothetical protein
MGVLSYAIAHGTFPHESTLNQFFSESQFESYRALGYEIADRAFKSGDGLAVDAATGAPPTFLSIVQKLKSQMPADATPAPRKYRPVRRWIALPSTHTRQRNSTPASSEPSG